MCIIVFKPKGVKQPSLETLNHCFDNNSDGAGFAIRRDEKVILLKGFMTLDSFMEAYNKQNITDDDEVLLHFRKSTSGVKDGTNCHPFPVSSDKEILKKEKITTVKTVVAHNGIIYKCIDKKQEELSDTMIFIKDILSDKAVISKIYKSECIRKLVEDFIGSTGKLAFLDGHNGFLKIGDFKEFKGCFFSNTSYEKKTVIISKVTSKKKSGNNYPYLCSCCKTGCRMVYRNLNGAGWMCNDCYDLYIGIKTKLKDIKCGYCGEINHVHKDRMKLEPTCIGCRFPLQEKNPLSIIKTTK